MYTSPADDDPPAEDGLPESAPEDDDGALAYTLYSVDEYTWPRICTDEVRIWETTVAVVNVSAGGAVSAASCCGDFTNEAPISPPPASRAAAMPIPSSTRRRRLSRDPRTASPPPLSAGREPGSVTRPSDASRSVKEPGISLRAGSALPG